MPARRRRELRRIEGDMEIAHPVRPEQPFDHQPGGGHPGEVGCPAQKRHLVPGRGKQAPEDGAERPGPSDQDSRGHRARIARFRDI